MTALAASAIDNRWQSFTQLAQSALQRIGMMQGPAQWIVAEPCDDGGRCVFSYGPGPLAVDQALSWPLPDAPVNHQNGFLVGMPLATTDHGYLGLWLPEQSGPPCDTDLALLHSKAILLGALLDQIRTSERLLRELEDVRHDAHTDALTGLANRRGWMTQVEREQARCDRYGAACSMVAIDLDELKRINDQQGHCAGDRLLRQTARAINATIRKPDVCARIGGDEFVVMLAESDESAAHGFCERLRKRLKADGIAASVGAATRLADEPLRNTLCRADADMYTHKHASRT
jgi:diguanylate cyclase (GGDEF)-like protein